MGIKPKEKAIAIIDCNNFYVSCERLFNPSLDNKPTVVLSNNDGCIIARSQEVKDIGIKMGQPIFELDDNIKCGINKFSSNYALYGDISDRITKILKRIVKKVEVYSIDESFLDLSDIEENKIKDHIIWIKSTLEKLTGIPVSIGVAPNKTLAKLCNKLSKTDDSLNGCCSYWDIDKERLYSLSVDKIWGIGRKWSKKLKSIRVENVKQFLDLKPIQVKKMFNVNGLRTWYELNEVTCYPISTDFKKPKVITSSRTFGKTQSNLLQIKDAFYSHLKATHKKLIKENLLTYKVNLFITTNRFNDDYFVWSRQVILSQGIDNIHNIWNEISPHLDDIPHKQWNKCGIQLSDLNSQKQLKMFDEEFETKEKPYVKQQLWETRREFLTPEYTTNWNDLPLVF